MATLNIDENRFLIKKASPLKITGKWKEVVNEIIESYKDHLGDRLTSVYIGGSAAHGEAIENKSDVDTYAIVNMDRSEVEANNNSWIKEERKRLSDKFPFLRGIEMQLSGEDTISESKKFQIKVYTALVYGKDLGKELEPYKMDKETFARIRFSIEKKISKTQKELEETTDPEKIKKLAIYISKTLIRSAGMMCMFRGDIYTMEVDKLVEIFASHYPTKEREIGRLVEYTQNPPLDKNEILDMLESFGSWLVAEDRRVFDI